MPICITCKQDKAESEFWWRWKEKGIRQKVCKTCRSVETSTWYEKHHDEHRQKVAARLAEKRQVAREFVWDYLASHPCQQCGEADPSEPLIAPDPMMQHTKIML